MAKRAYSAEEIVLKLDALALWDKMAHCNFAVKLHGVAMPYFCSTIVENGPLVKVRFLMLDGWQTFHDYMHRHVDPFVGFCSSPMELPHFEAVVTTQGTCAFFRYDAGFIPREVTEAQKKLLARILWETYGVMMRLETDERLPLKFSNEEAMFARVEKEKGVWVDAPLPLIPPRPHVERVTLDPTVLRVVKDLPMVPDETLDVDFRLLTGLRGGDKADLAVYGLLGYDAQKGEVAFHCAGVLLPDGGLRQIWEAQANWVLRALASRRRVPSHVRLMSNRLFRLLRPLTLELSFKLSLHDALPELNKAFANPDLFL